MPLWKRLVLVTFFLPAVLLVALGASLITVPVAEPDNFADFHAALDRRIPQLMDKHQVPGVAVAVVHQGDVVWVEGYGVTDTAAGIPVSADTVFQVGSISKPVSAWGVMRLVEQGKLELDTPISTYLTRWHLPPSAYDQAGVTVRRLLSHTAGLSLHGYAGFPPEEPVQTLEQSLTFAKDAGVGVAVIQEPGMAWRYSGGGYALLQFLVEEVSGQPFAHYMQREVLDPLGMEESSFVWRPALQPATATAYDADGQPMPNYRFTAKADAGLYTMAGDLARFVSAHMPSPDGQPAGRGVLAPDTVQLMGSPVPNATYRSGPFTIHDDGLGYNLHTPILSDGPVVIGHGGANRGWKAAFLTQPERGDGIVILTNGDGGELVHWEAQCLWVGWVLQDTIPHCLPMRVPRNVQIAGVLWVVAALTIIAWPVIHRMRRTGLETG